MLLFLNRHGIPFLCSGSIDPNIEYLDTDEEDNVVTTDANKDAIADTVIRLVFITIDLVTC